jgi:hypothetical protein
VFDIRTDSVISVGVANIKKKREKNKPAFPPP